MTRLRRFHLAPRAALAVGVAGVCAALATSLVGGSGGAWFWGLLAVAVVVVLSDAALAVAPHDLRFERVVAPSTTIESPTPMTLVIRNGTDRGALLDVHDAAPRSLRRDPRDNRLWLPARSRAEVHAVLQPARRGDLPLGPLTVRSSGPLGLAGRQEVVELPGSLRVLPRLPGRAEVELRLAGRTVLTAGVRRTRVIGNGTEFDHLREHHPDDDFRRINPFASARAGRPIATVLREEKNQHVMVLVDASRAMAPRVAGVPRLELAIDAAVAVAEMAARTGDHVGALAFDATVRARVAPRSGRRQGLRVLDALFAVEPSLEAAGHRNAFAQVLARNRRRSLLMLLTDLPDASAIDPLLDALPALVRRHVVIVGAVRDPAVAQALAADPTDSEAAHLAAAAATTLADRSAAARRLTALGARVVDTTPDRLAGAMVDAYLDVKGAGRL